MNESFYMHPRYEEFKAFIDWLETDARINPNSLNLAFDVWLNLKTQLCDFVEKTTKSIQVLTIDKKLMKGELDALKSMNTALTESNDILKTALNEVSE